MTSLRKASRIEFIKSKRANMGGFEEDLASAEEMKIDEMTD